MIAGSPMFPVLVGAPEGLVGTLTYATERPDNSVVLAPSAASIVESSPGLYTATRVAPLAKGTYLHVWYDSVNDVSAGEQFEVTVVAPLTGLLRYASSADMRAHEGLEEDRFPDELLQRPLLKAQHDIDAACGPGWRTFSDTGLKFSTDDTDIHHEYWDGAFERYDWDGPLWTNRLAAVKRATCAQAYYRMLVGDDFMVREQYEAQVGPDYSAEGQLRKVPGHVYTILQEAGLLRLGGRAGTRRRYEGIPRAN